jgi:cbb3-type cytochrome oxidase subunit 3
MFKQFLDKVDGNQGYLLSSFGIFMLFFILVAILLLTMKKDEIKYMSELPLNDEQDERGN